MRIPLHCVTGDKHNRLGRSCPVDVVLLRYATAACLSDRQKVIEGPFSEGVVALLNDWREAIPAGNPFERQTSFLTQSIKNFNAICAETRNDMRFFLAAVYDIDLKGHIPKGT